MSDTRNHKGPWDRPSRRFPPGRIPSVQIGIAIGVGLIAVAAVTERPRQQQSLASSHPNSAVTGASGQSCPNPCRVGNEGPFGKRDWTVIYTYPVPSNPPSIRMCTYTGFWSDYQLVGLQWQVTTLQGGKVAVSNHRAEKARGYWKPVLGGRPLLTAYQPQDLTYVREILEHEETGLQDKDLRCDNLATPAGR